MIIHDHPRSSSSSSTTFASVYVCVSVSWQWNCSFIIKKFQFGVCFGPLAGHIDNNTPWTWTRPSSASRSLSSLIYVHELHYVVSVCCCLWFFVFFFGTPPFRSKMELASQLASESKSMNLNLNLNLYLNQDFDWAGCVVVVVVPFFRIWVIYWVSVNSWNYLQSQMLYYVQSEISLSKQT